MNWTQRLALSGAVVVLALLGSACGGDDADSAADDDAPITTEPEPAATSPTTSAATSTSGGACEAAERIVAIDDEVDVIVQDHLTPVISGGDAAAFETFLAEYQDLLVTRLDEIAAAYEDLASAAPDDLTDAVETLESGSEQFSAVILEAETLDDLSSGFAALGEEVTENADATQRLDEYTRAECDLVLAD
jgi:hypothetical protein